MASNQAAEKIAPCVFLGMTAVTGLVDAVSFLSLGRVFTANMTGWRSLQAQRWVRSSSAAPLQRRLGLPPQSPRCAMRHGIGHYARAMRLDGPLGSPSLSSVNRNVAPGPVFAIAHNRPPCDSTIERVMARPIPVPCGFVVTNDSKI